MVKVNNQQKINNDHVEQNADHKEITDKGDKGKAAKSHDTPPAYQAAKAQSKHLMAESGKGTNGGGVYGKDWEKLIKISKDSPDFSRKAYNEHIFNKVFGGPSPDTISLNSNESGPTAPLNENGDRPMKQVTKPVPLLPGDKDIGETHEIGEVELSKQTYDVTYGKGSNARQYKVVVRNVDSYLLDKAGSMQYAGGMPIVSSERTIEIFDKKGVRVHPPKEGDKALLTEGEADDLARQFSSRKLG